MNSPTPERDPGGWRSLRAEGVKSEGEKPLPISLPYINNKYILLFYFPEKRV